MKYNIIFFVAFIFLLLPATSHAGEFVNLVGIPGLSGDPTGEGGLNAYINALYRLSISIAALLAVIKIVIAGAKYMLSDIVTHKEDAKKDIQGALIGLLIVIGAIIILNTINTDLTNLDLTVNTVTIEQDPMTVQELIAQQMRTIEDSVTADQSERQDFNCPYYTWTEGSDMARCMRECREMRGNFSIGYINNGCSISTSLAANCNPDTNVMCCEDVNYGEWTEGDVIGTGSCSGVTEGRNARRLECGEEGRVWDEAGNYCRTASCNANTDANCCAALGRTIQNGICSSTTNDVTSEQECIDRGDGWAYIAGTCRQQTSGNVTQQLPTPRPADPYTHCARIEPPGSWEFNESADFCQRIPTN